MLKDLKESTRQRMVAIELGYPEPAIEQQVVVAETGVAPKVAEDLVRLAAAIRKLDTPGLREVTSTRCLVSTARLHLAGLGLLDAARSAIAQALTDDAELASGLNSMIDAYLKSWK